MFSTAVLRVTRPGLPVGHHRDEAVNVRPEVHLDQVSVLETGVGLAQERRVVADHVVHGDAGWEGDTWGLKLLKRTENLQEGNKDYLGQRIQ